MISSSLTTWPPESNFILKQRIACQMKALKKSFKMRVRVAGLSSLNGDEFLVCSSIHAAAWFSWASKSATPNKAFWSQFESFDNSWHLKRKP
jgi:hypothetical protein